MVEIIRKKRDGKCLTRSEIERFVSGVRKGEIPDYQISALLMAIYYKGMDLQETTDLTSLMIETGVSFDLADISGCKVDKHSTGGVGDKISLILAPLAAEMGITVPMISGKGLGHTGGTVDKLESIPGYRANIQFDEFKKILIDVGCSIISQTDDIAPVDRELYALRDVTATVESIPLITSSILSKKLSEDLDGLVIDLKVGKGAFMKDIESAKRLGEWMKKVGEALGTKIKIVFTDQSSPLGRNVGNAVEVFEAIEILKGNFIEDTVEVTLALVEEMCKIARVTNDASAILKSVRAYERFRKMVKLHGGDLSKLKTHSNPYEVKSKNDGIIEFIDAYKIGIASLYAGAGREKRDEKVDPKAGIKLLKKEGDEVKKEETVALIYTKRTYKIIKDMVLSAYRIGNKEPSLKSRIIERW
ncbi:MAG: thymidine phosphorylase [Candidatus Stahlbacteria bacterium]|nr:MAG: thymidine phosphorylase [Candidatus Stahlbacteria bacterium]